MRKSLRQSETNHPILVSHIWKLLNGIDELFLNYLAGVEIIIQSQEIINPADKTEQTADEKASTSHSTSESNKGKD